MRKILQVMTRENDELAEAIAAANRDADMPVVVIRLTPERADFAQLLEAIFEADSVQSW